MILKTDFFLFRKKNDFKTKAEFTFIRIIHLIIRSKQVAIRIKQVAI